MKDVEHMFCRRIEGIEELTQIFRLCSFEKNSVKDQQLLQLNNNENNY